MDHISTEQQRREGNRTTTVILDRLLRQDLSVVRTLSAFAAGIGGPTLAIAFRCLCFVYRHYGGGLPDLTLLRAVVVPRDDEGGDEKTDDDGGDEETNKKDAT